MNEFEREVSDKLSAAVARLLECDSYLLINDVNERSISHRLAMYLQEEFDQWDVDCEYNRNYDDVKTLEIPWNDASPVDTDAVTVFPDIIVHHRDSDDNLLVIEMKKTTSRKSSTWDLKKLVAYKQGLGYHFGVFLKLSTGSDNADVAELRWI